MEWIKNAKIMAIFLVRVLGTNAGTGLWIIKHVEERQDAANEIARMEKELLNALSSIQQQLAKIQENETAAGPSEQDLLSILKQMDERLAKLEERSARKERSEDEARANARSFFRAPKVNFGGEKRY